MRNIFDQYSQPENRLTHALASCLDEDANLLRDFVEWLTAKPAPDGRLRIVEQSIPGQPSADEDGAGDSLPDAWIYSDDGWSLLIETKVQASIVLDQLNRHDAMAQRCGFETATVCVLSATPAPASLPSEVVHRRWPDVYEWLQDRRGTSEWARRMIDYMEVLETRMTASEYLTEGSLTTFTGIRFDDDHPFSPREAKRLLKLAMQEIRSSDRLPAIGADPALPGRGAIKESDLEIWDFIRLRRSHGDPDFAAWPHFTLGLRPDEILAVLILPNKWLDKLGKRSPLVDLGLDGFRRVVGEATSSLLSALGTSPTARPWVLLQQRRWARGRSAPPVADAVIAFDPTSAVASPAAAGTGGVKSQPQWLESVFEAIAPKDRGVNIEVCIGGRFSFEDDSVRSRAFPDRVIDAWCACAPLLDIVLTKDR